MKRAGEIGKAGWLNLDGGANCGSCGYVGEPKIDVFFYDVVENGDPPFMGGEVLSEDGHANVCVPGAYISKNIIKVLALVQFGGGVDVVD